MGLRSRKEFKVVPWCAASKLWLGGSPCWKNWSRIIGSFLLQRRHEAPPQPLNSGRGSLLLLQGTRHKGQGKGQKSLPYSKWEVCKAINEILFVVDEANEASYRASAIGSSIHTEADSLELLQREIRDAVQCHFEEGAAPPLIRLQHGRQGP